MLIMTNVIILIYGEDRHLVLKPADYESLLDIARVKFPELHNLDNHNIAFHVNPEWFDGEVQLDRSAFAEVHDHEVLRITTRIPASARHPGNDSKIPASGFARSDSGPTAREGQLKLCVIHLSTGREGWFILSRRTKLSHLMKYAVAFFKVDRNDYNFYYQHTLVKENDTPEILALKDSDFIKMRIVS